MIQLVLSMLLSLLTPQKLESLLFAALGQLVKSTKSPIDDELLEITKLSIRLYRSGTVTESHIRDGLVAHKAWLENEVSKAETRQKA